ncbi:MAG TPA: hypothetical protein VFM38_13650 [Candidatus Limnocylindrales bacterium]|nr:hypothetical protein [Candidatus Limnocylindrales bacterium]
MRQARPAVIGPQTLDVGVGETERRERPLQLAFVLARVDVDPQETLRTERPDDLLGQRDATIVGIRVEEADGDIAQCSALNRTAAATAMKATTYWSTSMVRSWVGSAAHDRLCLAAGSNSIDV